MLPSVRAFLAGVIDYAGLFPPAQLPLDQAIRNYARYRREPESWMLGRFVCPVARLSELEAFADLFEPRAPLALSVLAQLVGSSGTFSFDRDAEAIQSFEDHLKGKA